MRLCSHNEFYNKNDGQCISCNAFYGGDSFSLEVQGDKCFKCGESDNTILKDYCDNLEAFRSEFSTIVAIKQKEPPADFEAQP